MAEILLRVPQVGMVGKGIPCPEGRCRPFSPDCRGEGKEMGRGSTPSTFLIAPQAPSSTLHHTLHPLTVGQALLGPGDPELGLKEE